MAQATYDEVVRLAEQLTREEQRALIAHLQEVAEQRELTDEEWNAVFDSMKISVQPDWDFSLRRENWYGDDGR